MNTRGFIRIVEAVIAILIVLGALLILSLQREAPASRDLSEIIPQYLDEIAQNATLRRSIVEEYETNESYSEINNRAILREIEVFLEPRILSSTLNYSVRVCDLQEICFLDPYPSEADEGFFAAERVMTTTLSQQGAFAPKKLKLFLWKRR